MRHSPQVPGLAPISGAGVQRTSRLTPCWSYHRARDRCRAAPAVCQVSASDEESPLLPRDTVSLPDLVSSGGDRLMGRRQRVGISPIHCSARCKPRGGERCRMRAVPGTTVCRQHGGESPQALARAQVRLTLAELASTDPRPMAEVLRDAVALADVAQRDCWSALRAGELTPAVADRLLETARYSAALVKVAVGSGLPCTTTTTGCRWRRSATWPPTL